MHLGWSIQVVPQDATGPLPERRSDRNHPRLAQVLLYAGVCRWTRASRVLQSHANQMRVRLGAVPVLHAAGLDEIIVY